MKTSINNIFITILMLIMANVGFTQRKNRMVQDVDGNKYQTVRIGNLDWMSENLRTAHFSSGESILESFVSKYDNNIYYSWITTTKDVCPLGWRIPSNDDWDAMENLFGGEDVAGVSLKSDNEDSWGIFALMASNSSGFSAQPSGYVNELGKLNNKGKFAYWWSSSDKDSETAWGREIGFNQKQVYKGYASKKDGLSIRCVKDVK